MPSRSFRPGMPVGGRSPRSKGQWVSPWRQGAGGAQGKSPCGSLSPRGIEGAHGNSLRLSRWGDVGGSVARCPVAIKRWWDGRPMRRRRQYPRRVIDVVGAHPEMSSFLCEGSVWPRGRERRPLLRCHSCQPKPFISPRMPEGRRPSSPRSNGQGVGPQDPQHRSRPRWAPYSRRRCSTEALAVLRFLELGVEAGGRGRARQFPLWFPQPARYRGRARQLPSIVPLGRR